MKNSRIVYSILLPAVIFAFLTPSSNADEYYAVTPSRMKQSISDTPAAVTVIHAKDLKRLGIFTVPEAMRLVPGMSVVRKSGGEYAINYHGGDLAQPRKIQVLVDGVEQYRQAFSYVDWSSLPVTLDRIDRIEVTRSPASSTYGANSFSAVVNILTTPPELSGTGISMSAATDENYRLTVRGNSLLSDGGFAWYAEHYSTTGYHDDVIPQPLVDFVPNTVRDSFISNKAGVSYNRILPSGSEFNTSLNYVLAQQQDEWVSLGQASVPDNETRDAQFMASYKTDLSSDHSLDFNLVYTNFNNQTRWDACMPGIAFTQEMRDLYNQNPIYAQVIAQGQIPSGGTPQDDLAAYNVFVKAASMGTASTSAFCGQVNHDFNTKTTKLSIDDYWQLADQLRVQSSATYQVFTSTSDTHLSEPETDYLAALQANAEYRPTDQVTFNFGMMYESNSLVSEPMLSPRVSINYHYAQEHTAKLVYSTGKRSPDVAEQKRYWKYPVKGLPVDIFGSSPEFFILAKSNAFLEPEEITSTEIILSGRPSSAFSYEIKLFDEQLTNLITERDDFLDFRLSNNSSTSNKGLEVSIDQTLSDSVLYGFGYSYQNPEENLAEDIGLSNRHSGFAHVTYQAGSGYSLALVYSGYAPLDGKKYNQVHATYSQALEFGSSILEVTATAAFRSNNIVDERDRTLSFNSPRAFILNLEYLLQ